ncbi:hypothetical protein BC936DRAFT_147993 [Jimgerdemannia flammicorona]|uniref:Regulator of chromosome condensation 1/beta-lactamase-inhibitor protein II n=1 Tax=Jimgerdemannia flammicorona TaxID=994334 RepID=A0A433D416_9FUNG|nr:hypothetical protein BC936DRAFT_147993 [Jimgerdemannia flammicorona]
MGCHLDEGELWTWGNSEYGQCMHGKKINRVSNCFISTGYIERSPSVYIYMHLPSRDSTSQVLEPTRVPTAGHTVVDVAAGGPFSLFLTGM